MSALNNLKRKTILFPDGDDGRVYFDEMSNYASVTTILDRRDDPGKERGLRFWRDKHDGAEGNADHEHLFKYAGWRGTIIHWYVLQYLCDELGGEEEDDALAEIRERDTDYDWVFSTAELRSQKRDIYANPLSDVSPTEYYDQPENEREPTLTDYTCDDCAWALQAFFDNAVEMGLANQNWSESNCKTVESYVSRDVRTSQIIDVERFVLNENERYAGQFDLLYEHPERGTVLCDLKTSSRVRWKHRAQSVAYSHAIEEDIDDFCIVRLYPDGRESELVWEEDYRETREELWDEFTDLCAKVHRQIEFMEEETDDGWDVSAGLLS